MCRQYGKKCFKDKRFIELGWVHKRHLRAKQVHLRAGGGTRKVCIKKDCQQSNIFCRSQKSGESERQSK